MFEGEKARQALYFVLIIDSGCGSHAFNCLSICVNEFSSNVRGQQYLDDTSSKYKGARFRGRGLRSIRSCLLCARDPHMSFIGETDGQGCETRFLNEVCEIIRSYDKKSFRNTMCRKVQGRSPMASRHRRRTVVSQDTRYDQCLRSRRGGNLRSRTPA